MKKIIALLLIAALCFSFAACGKTKSSQEAGASGNNGPAGSADNTAGDPTGDPAADATGDPAADATAAPTEAPDDGPKPFEPYVTATHVVSDHSGEIIRTSVDILDIDDRIIEKRITAADGSTRVNTYNYNEHGDLVYLSFEDTADNKYEWEYDAEGRPTRRTLFHVSDGEETKMETEVYEYHDGGYTVSKTEEFYEYTSKREYDTEGRLIKSVNITPDTADNSEYTYDDHGELLTARIKSEFAGSVSEDYVLEYENKYDANGNLLEQTAYRTGYYYEYDKKIEFENEPVSYLAFTYDDENRLISKTSYNCFGTYDKFDKVLLFEETVTYELIVE